MFTVLFILIYFINLCVVLYTFLYKLSNWWIWIFIVKNIEISCFWNTNTWSIFNFQFICKYFNKLLNIEIFSNIRGCCKLLLSIKKIIAYLYILYRRYSTVQIIYILVHNDINIVYMSTRYMCSTKVCFFKLYGRHVLRLKR